MTNSLKNIAVFITDVYAMRLWGSVWTAIQPICREVISRDVSSLKWSIFQGYDLNRLFPIST